jgi:hypothetical protein
MDDEYLSTDSPGVRETKLAAIPNAEPAFFPAQTYYNGLIEPPINTDEDQQNIYPPVAYTYTEYDENETGIDNPSNNLVNVDLLIGQMGYYDDQSNMIKSHFPEFNPDHYHIPLDEAVETIKKTAVPFILNDDTFTNEIKYIDTNRDDHNATIKRLKDLGRKHNYTFPKFVYTGNDYLPYHDSVMTDFGKYSDQLYGKNFISGMEFNRNLIPPNFTLPTDTNINYRVNRDLFKNRPHHSLISQYLGGPEDIFKNDKSVPRAQLFGYMVSKNLDHPSRDILQDYFNEHVHPTHGRARDSYFCSNANTDVDYAKKRKKYFDALYEKDIFNHFSNYHPT